MRKPDDGLILIFDKRFNFFVQRGESRAFQKNFFRVRHFDAGVDFPVFLAPGARMENRLGVHQNIVLFKYAEFFVGQNVTETAHTFTFAALYVEKQISHNGD